MSQATKRADFGVGKEAQEDSDSIQKNTNEKIESEDEEKGDEERFGGNSHCYEKMQSDEQEEDAKLT